MRLGEKKKKAVCKTGTQYQTNEFSFGIMDYHKNLGLGSMKAEVHEDTSSRLKMTGPL
jgi:hypothetical protein